MTRAGLALLLVCAGSAATAGTGKQAKTKTAAKHAHSRFSAPSDADDAPAVRYAAMSQDECEAELGNRSISFTRETARGVVAPVRLTGPLHGVTYRTNETEDHRAASLYEIADCRLVLALDDFAAILESHDIVEVRHYSIYRPPSKRWPEDKAAAQHNGALALDAGTFIDKDGNKLDVLKQFHGHIGAQTCGDGAGPHPATADAKKLREILCDAVEQHLFNVVLTPNFNRPHRNHFHLEVTAGVKWFLVH